MNDAGNTIRQAHNLCITGPTGCGKTGLACALGNQACRQGLSVRYLRLPALFEFDPLPGRDRLLRRPFGHGQRGPVGAASPTATAPGRA